MLTLAFMTIRVILLRRSAVRTFPDGTPAHAIGMDGVPHPERPQPVGVPPDVVATFPLFKFNVTEFEEMRKHNSLRRTAAANAAAAAAAAASGGGGCAAVDTPVNGTAGAAAASPGQAASGAAARRPSSGHTSDAETGSPLGGPGDDDDGPTCSVCICAFEEGEVLRRLPCQHVYHQACIDAWMLQHNTCPNCRWALCPDAAAHHDRRGRCARGSGLGLCFGGLMLR